jgi:hypothetical protein
MVGRHRGSSVCVVAGLLFLCLACLEIPEISTLTDDVSNDFTILIRGSDSSEAIVCVKAAEAKRGQPAATQQIEFVPLPIVRTATRPGSRDLLAFYSLRRT